MTFGIAAALGLAWWVGHSGPDTDNSVLPGVPRAAAEAQIGQTGQTIRTKVVEVVDGDTVLLANGRQVRLIGLQAPKLPLGRAGFKTWPLAAESKQALEKLILGRNVILRQWGAPEDRYGRLLGHLYRDDGLWVQGQMISDGFARVYSFYDNRLCVRVLLERERAARAAARGIWRLHWYAPRAPEDTMADLNTFQIVEGTIVSAANIRGRIYLNFGEDWREDFTATIAPGDLKRFADAPFDPAALAGQTVRLRGWLTSYNGPNMELTHPEQIELPGTPLVTDDERRICENGGQTKTAAPSDGRSH